MIKENATKFTHSGHFFQILMLGNRKSDLIFPLNWSILLPFIVSLLDNWNASLGLVAGGLPAAAAAPGGLGWGLTGLTGGLSDGFSAYEVSSSMSEGQFSLEHEFEKILNIQHTDTFQNIVENIFLNNWKR